MKRATLQSIRENVSPEVLQFVNKNGELDHIEVPFTVISKKYIQDASIFIGDKVTVTEVLVGEYSIAPVYVINGKQYPFSYFYVSPQY